MHCSVLSSLLVSKLYTDRSCSVSYCTATMRDHTLDGCTGKSPSPKGRLANAEELVETNKL